MANIFRSIKSINKSPVFLVAKDVAKDAVKITYFSGIFSVGVLGFLVGIDETKMELKNHKPIKLSHEFKKYEIAVDSIVVSGKYMSNGLATCISFMGIMAFFPIIVPAFIYFSESE